MRAQEIAVGTVPLLASRVTYVGELGWELYAPGGVRPRALRRAHDGRCRARPARRRLPRDRVDAAGEGLPRLGHRPDARDDARVGGRGLRGAARQGHAVHRPGGAARRARAGGPSERLACLVLEDPRSVCLGSEPVRIDGELCGRVTSGGYGSRVRRSIALAYVPAAHAVRRHARRGRGLRRVGTGRGRGGRALRSGRRTHPRLRSPCSSTITSISRPTASRLARRSSRLPAWRCTPRAPASAASTTSA